MSIAEKMSEIAENVPLVYQAGKDKEWNDFWDGYQENGTKTTYSYAFYSSQWDKELFRPKYDIIPKRSTEMFEFFNKEKEPFDLAAHLEALGITLDLSQNIDANVTYMFYQMWVTRLPEIDFSHHSGIIISAFSYSTPLETIDKLILKDDGSQRYRNPFLGLPNLKNIVIEGAIGQDGINLSSSTQLSKASITSFVNALLESASGKSITFSLTAVNNAFETSAGAADGSTSEEWGTLIATKSNWTISLA